MTTSNRDALRHEWAELSAELSGLNPKLSLHAKIKARMNEIEALCGGDAAGAKIRRTMKGHGKSKKYRPYKEGRTY